MFQQAMQICLLLQGLEKKVKAAKADGTITASEQKELLIAFLAGIVDILESVLPVETIEAALADIEGIRERVKLYRLKSADVLDELSAAADEVLS